MPKITTGAVDVTHVGDGGAGDGGGQATIDPAGTASPGGNRGQPCAPPPSLSPLLSRTRGDVARAVANVGPKFSARQDATQKRPALPPSPPPLRDSNL